MENFNELTNISLLDFNFEDDEFSVFGNPDQTEEEKAALKKEQEEKLSKHIDVLDQKSEETMELQRSLMYDPEAAIRRRAEAKVAMESSKKVESKPASSYYQSGQSAWGSSYQTMSGGRYLSQSTPPKPTQKELSQKALKSVIKNCVTEVLKDMPEESLTYLKHGSPKNGKCQSKKDAFLVKGLAKIALQILKR